MSAHQAAPRFRPRWNLKHLAWLIAAVALSFAILGIPGTVVGLFFTAPAVFARGIRRQVVLFYSATIYPITGLLALYMTWITAWLALGHRPRSSLDDPKDIDAIMVPYFLFRLMFMGVVVAFPISIALMFREVSRLCRVDLPSNKAFLPLLYVPLAWLGSYFLLRSDPLGVLDWYMD